jgi:hypothetical protein
MRLTVAIPRSGPPCPSRNHNTEASNTSGTKTVSPLGIRSHGAVMPRAQTASNAKLTQMSMAERGPGANAELSSASSATTAKGAILVRVEPRAKGLLGPT